MKGHDEVSEPRSDPLASVPESDPIDILRAQIARGVDVKLIPTPPYADPCGVCVVVGVDLPDCAADAVANVTRFSRSRYFSDIRLVYVEPVCEDHLDEAVTYALTHTLGGGSVTTAAVDVYAGDAS